MGITYGSHDLVKRIIDWREVEKVMYNGSQIWPSAVPPTPLQPVDEGVYDFNRGGYTWWTVVQDTSSNENIITLNNFPNIQFARYYSVDIDCEVQDGEHFSWEFLEAYNKDTVSNNSGYIQIESSYRETRDIDVSEIGNVLTIRAENYQKRNAYESFLVDWLIQDSFIFYTNSIETANWFRVKESLSQPIQTFVLTICSSRAKFTEHGQDGDILFGEWVYWNDEFVYSCSPTLNVQSFTLDPTNKTFELRTKYTWQGHETVFIWVWEPWVDTDKFWDYRFFYI